MDSLAQWASAIWRKLKTFWWASLPLSAWAVWDWVTNWLEELGQRAPNAREVLQLLDRVTANWLMEALTVYVLAVVVVEFVRFQQNHNRRIAMLEATLETRTAGLPPPDRIQQSDRLVRSTAAYLSIGDGMDRVQALIKPFADPWLPNLRSRWIAIDFGPDNRAEMRALQDEAAKLDALIAQLFDRARVVFQVNPIEVFEAAKLAEVRRPIVAGPNRSDRAIRDPEVKLIAATALANHLQDIGRERLDTARGEIASVVGWHGTGWQAQ